jgi:hypothetical protein
MMFYDIWSPNLDSPTLLHKPEKCRCCSVFELFLIGSSGPELRLPCSSNYVPKKKKKGSPDYSSQSLWLILSMSATTSFFSPERGSRDHAPLPQNLLQVYTEPYVVPSTHTQDNWASCRSTRQTTVDYKSSEQLDLRFINWTSRTV